MPQLTSIKHQHQFDLQRTATQLTDTSSTSSPDFTTTAGLYPELAAETAVMASYPTRELASILIDARLPAPAILVRNHDVPLSLTVRKVNAFAGQLYLRSLHVALIGYTTVQKQQRPSSSSSSRSMRSRSPSPAGRDQQEQGKRTKQREKADTWVIASTCNLRVPVGHPDAPVGARLALPPALWQDRPVPASVAPSFDVLCGGGAGGNNNNGGGVAVTRTYELEVTLGLAYEAEEQQRPERVDGESEEEEEEEQRPLSRTVWLPLRRKVEVYADFPVADAGDVSVCFLDSSPFLLGEMNVSLLTACC